MMKWLMLYARSRQVPVWAAAVALTTLAACVFEQGGREPMDLGIATLILTTNVTAASVGLGGQDLALDRTAAIRWAPRRTAHVLLLGAVAAVALLAVQVTGPALPLPPSCSGTAPAWPAWPHSGPRWSGRRTRGPCRPAGSRSPSSPRR